ncbi:MAG: hypothetical protein NUV81_02835 [bacterium]|nr:hypothetical protein [bacterium]
MLFTSRFRSQTAVVAGVLFLFAFVILAPSANAACSVTLTDGDLIVNPIAPIVDDFVKLYVTVDPNCSLDLEGWVTFRADDSQLGQKPFSYKSSGKPEEVWIGWTPTTAKTYLIQVDVSSVEEGGIIPASLTRAVLVDVDIDNDGVGDSIDTDDDNDGVLDVNDDFPLDPSKQTDTDGDGIDNSVDSDDDNDGLYDYKEVVLQTNPENHDTDGDGAWDKQDAFPLDPSKTEEVVVVPAVVSHSNPDSQNTATTFGIGEIDTGSVDERNSEEGADETPRRLYVNAERTIEPVEDPGEDVQAVEQEDLKARSKKTPWLWGLAASFLSLSGFFLQKDHKRRKDMG